MYRIYNKDLQSLTINNASPVLLGVKPSSLLLVPRNVEGYKNWLNDLNSQGIDVYPMYCIKNKIAILIYDKEHLLEHLIEDGAKNYLNGLGYNFSNGLIGALRTLKLRLRDYQLVRYEYPHEIGIFLGYPYEDVMDFASQNKECKVNAYWKVYNDTDKAMKIIDNYNKARNLALIMYNNGYGIKDIMQFRGAV